MMQHWHTFSLDKLQDNFLKSSSEAIPIFPKILNWLRGGMMSVQALTPRSIRSWSLSLNHPPFPQ